MQKPGCRVADLTEEESEFATIFDKVPQYFQNLIHFSSCLGTDH